MRLAVLASTRGHATLMRTAPSIAFLIAACSLVGACSSNGIDESSASSATSVGRVSVTAAGTADGKQIALVTYLTGLEEALADNLSTPLCAGMFVAEHVADLADRLSALDPNQRLSNVLPDPNGGDGDFVIEIAGEKSDLRFGFERDRGIVCIATITSHSSLWRRLLPDPQIRNAEAARRYAKLADADLISDNRGTAQLDKVKQGFDRFFPEDDYPHPCGVNDRLTGVIMTFADRHDGASVMNAVGQYVAFCPYLDQDLFVSAVATAAPALVPTDLAAVVRKMFEVAQ